MFLLIVVVLILLFGSGNVLEAGCGIGMVLIVIFGVLFFLLIAA